MMSGRLAGLGILTTLSTPNLAGATWYYSSLSRIVVSAFLNWFSEIWLISSSSNWLYTVPSAPPSFGPDDPPGLRPTTRIPPPSSFPPLPTTPFPPNPAFRTTRRSLEVLTCFQQRPVSTENWTSVPFQPQQLSCFPPQSQFSGSWTMALQSLWAEVDLPEEPQSGGSYRWTIK